MSNWCSLSIWPLWSQRRTWPPQAAVTITPSSQAIIEEIWDSWISPKFLTSLLSLTFHKSSSLSQNLTYSKSKFLRKNFLCCQTWEIGKSRKFYWPICFEFHKLGEFKFSQARKFPAPNFFSLFFGRKISKQYRWNLQTNQYHWKTVWQCRRASRRSFVWMLLRKCRGWHLSL